MNEEELLRMVVRLIGDTEAYQEMFQKAADSADQLKEATKGAAQAERIIQKSQEKGAEVTRQVEKASEKYSRELRDMKGLLEQGHISQETFNRATKQSKDVLTQSSSAFKLVETAAQKYEREVKDLKMALDVGAISQREYTQNLRLASKEYRQAGNAATSYGKQIQSIGRSGFLKITLPILGIGAASVAAGTQIQTAFGGVRKTVNATEEQLQGLKQQFEDFITQDNAPFDLTELLGTAEVAGQLGINFDNIFDFTKVVENLKLASNLGEDAASSLARIANITNLPQTQFSNLASTIVALGNTTATTEREIVGMTMRLAGAGSQVGLTVPQIAALSASLSSVGIEAEAGGTAFSQLFLNLSKQVATGGKELEAFASTAQMSIQDFSSLFREDAAGAVKALLRGLNELEGDKAILALEAMGIEGARLTDALLRSSQSVDLMENAMRTAEQAFVDNTALTQEAEVRYESFSSAIKNAYAQLKILGEQIFQVVEPALRKIINIIKKGINFFSEMSTEAKALTIALGLVAASIPPLLSGFGGLLYLTGTVTTAFSTMTIAGYSLTGALTAVKVAAMPIVSALLPIVGTVAAIGASFVLLVGRGNTLSEKLSSTFDQIANMVSVASNIIVGGVKGIGEILVNTFSEPLSNIGKFVSKVSKPFTDLFFGVLDSASQFGAGLLEVLGILDLFKDFGTGKDAGEGIAGYFLSGMQAVSEFNRETQRAIELNKELQGVLDKGFSSEIADIQLIADPDKQLAELQDFQTQIELDLEGIANQIGSQQKKISEEFGGFDRVFNNGLLAIEEQTLKELETRRDQLRQQAKELQQLIAQGAVVPDAEKVQASQASATPSMDVRETFEKATKSSETLVQSFQQELRSVGLEERQSKILELQVEATQLKEAGLDVTGLEEQIKQLQNLDAQINVKVKAQKIEEEVSSIMESLQYRVETFGMDQQQIQVFDLQQLGASEEQIARIVELTTTLKEKTDFEKKKQDADKLIEQYLPPEQKFEKRQQELQSMLDEGLIDQATFEAAVTDAEKQLDGLKEKTDRDYSFDLSVKGIDAVEADSAEALARVNAFLEGGTDQVAKVEAPATPQPPETKQELEKAEQRLQEKIVNIEKTISETTSTFRLVRLEESLDYAQTQVDQIRESIASLDGQNVSIGLTADSIMLPDRLPEIPDQTQRVTQQQDLIQQSEDFKTQRENLEASRTERPRLPHADDTIARAIAISIQQQNLNKTDSGSVVSTNQGNLQNIMSFAEGNKKFLERTGTENRYSEILKQSQQSQQSQNIFTGTQVNALESRELSPENLSTTIPDSIPQTINLEDLGTLDLNLPLEALSGSLMTFEETIRQIPLAKTPEALRGSQRLSEKVNQTTQINSLNTEKVNRDTQLSKLDIREASLVKKVRNVETALANTSSNFRATRLEESLNSFKSQLEEVRSVKETLTTGSTLTTAEENLASVTSSRPSTEQISQITLSEARYSQIVSQDVSETAQITERVSNAENNQTPNVSQTGNEQVLNRIAQAAERLVVITEGRPIVEIQGSDLF